jgi:hypothetical protein
MTMLREAAAGALVTIFGLAACERQVPTVVIAAGAGAPDAGAPIPWPPVVIPPTDRLPPDAVRQETRAKSEPCPDDFAAAQQRVGCTIAVTNGCAYGPARCTCIERPQCGGETAMPAGPGGPGLWRCGSTDPKQLDPRGCPYVQPADGSTCEKSGASCYYGACDWYGTRSTCEGGKWKSELVRGPGPP